VPCGSVGGHVSKQIHDHARTAVSWRHSWLWTRLGITNFPVSGSQCHVVRESTTSGTNTSPPSSGLKIKESRRESDLCWTSSLLLFISSFILRLWRWKWYFPEKRLVSYQLHSVTTQKTVLFIEYFLRRFNFEWKYNVLETIYQLTMKELRHEHDNWILSLQSSRKIWFYIKLICKIYCGYSVSCIYIYQILETTPPKRSFPVIELFFFGT
jgi:hypothetical protein